MDPLSALSGADVAMVAVTMVIVQIVKYFLPAPVPEIPGEKISQWAVVKRLAWVPLLMAFAVAIGLSIAFDQHVGQPMLGKVREGLQTGAYAVAAWEVYGQIRSKIVAALKGG